MERWEKPLNIGVVRVKFNKFSYIEHEAVKTIDKKIDTGDITFVVPNDMKDRNLPENTGVVSVTTNLTLYNNNFDTSGEINGIYVVPDKYTRIIENDDKSDSDVEMLKDLVDKLMPTLVSKMQVYSGLFSTENNSYTILHDFKFDPNSLRRS